MRGRGGELQVFPGCPCLPREGAAFGACPAGYQCAVQWQGDIWPALSINSTVLRSGALCMPCALGQHCPRGSFQPAPGPAASSYVLSHLCRSAPSSLLLHYTSFSPFPLPRLPGWPAIASAAIRPAVKPPAQRTGTSHMSGKKIYKTLSVEQRNV